MAAPKEIWKSVIARVRSSRPLIRPWVESARPLGIEGRFLLLGFPAEEKMAMESLANPRTRDFLETLIQELSGQELKMKLLLKEGLPPPEEAAGTSRESQVTNGGDTQALFKDDPLIQEALEIFKGEIKT